MVSYQPGDRESVHNENEENKIVCLTFVIRYRSVCYNPRCNFASAQVGPL
jgi:hypothetical protein